MITESGVNTEATARQMFQGKQLARGVRSIKIVSRGSVQALPDVITTLLLIKSNLWHYSITYWENQLVSTLAFPEMKSPFPFLEHVAACIIQGCTSFLKCNDSPNIDVHHFMTHNVYLCRLITGMTDNSNIPLTNALLMGDRGDSEEWPEKIILPQNKGWQQSISLMGDPEDLKKT